MARVIAMPRIYGLSRELPGSEEKCRSDMVETEGNAFDWYKLGGIIADYEERLDKVEVGLLEGFEYTSYSIWSKQHGFEERPTWYNERFSCTPGIRVTFSCGKIDYYRL